MTDRIDETLSPAQVAAAGEIAKHTPGPWKVNGSHIYGPDPERELIAQAHANEGSAAWSAVGGNRMIANRDLIAAAPELLEALKAVVNYFWEPLEVEGEPILSEGEVQELVLTVLRKAEG